MSTFLTLARNSHLDQVQTTLEAIGYERQAIVRDYDFAVPKHENSPARVDMAAFSDSVRHDLSTSCVAVQYITPQSNVEEVLDELPYLAPPVALFLRSDEVEIWPVSTKPIHHANPTRVPYNRLIQYFNQHARDFHPETLSTAKLQGQQLSFFDFDPQLLVFAFEATQRLLVAKFEAGVNEAKEFLRESQQPMPEDLPRLALQILAATILEDKQLFGTDRSSTVSGLMKRSTEKYSQYFDTALLNRIGREPAQITFETLRQSVTFRSFTNEMLGHFYENTFVTKGLRRQLGVYYTPQTIAKRILARLPIEDIPPSERVVFDGSSGSGNFLLAAFERLADLLPNNWDRDRRHRYLIQRVHGVDIDQFATLVAGLSLFFIDLPIGGQWNIRTADFLTLEPTKLPKMPTILVGNPPFEETRSLNGRRQQRAGHFLNKYLDMLVPGGLLGVVLPEALLENSSCSAVRRRLFEECEILELWHLPEGVFPISKVATVIVLARKVAKKQNSLQNPVRIEKVPDLVHEKKNFLSGARPRFSYVLPSAKLWIQSEDYRLYSSPLERSVWSKIRVQKKLEDVAQIWNGIIPGPDQRTTHIADSRHGTAWRPWLGSTKKMQPYFLNPAQPEYIKYPGNLHRPRFDLESIFASSNSKVLVNANRAPGNPWRIYAAIDNVGYFPSQGFYCVVPVDQSVTREEVVATLNSSFANAWVDSHNRIRWIGAGTLRKMPFPSFTDSMRQSVRDWVTEIMTLKQRALPGSPAYRREVNTIRELVLAIDDIVCEACEVDEMGRNALRDYVAGYRRPGFEWEDSDPSEFDAAPTSNGRAWTVTGQVIQTDAEVGTVTLWVRGYHNNQPFSIPIPETMPGWALQPEAAFEAKIPWTSRFAEDLPVHDLTDFQPLEFAYVEPEELVDLLEHPKRLDELYGV